MRIGLTKEYMGRMLSILLLYVTLASCSHVVTSIIPRAKPRDCAALEAIARRASLQGRRELSTNAAPDAEAMAAVIEKHIDRFSSCLDSDAKKGRPAGGKLLTQFIISENGFVQASCIQESTIDSSPIEACIVELLEQIRFPKPKAQGFAIVRMPLKFGK
jgi:hypothetical protein